MKKTSLLLIAVFWMSLYGCQTQPVQEQPTETQQAPVENSNIEYMYLDDEDIWFAQWEVVRMPVKYEEVNELKSNNPNAEDIKSEYSKYIIVQLWLVNAWNETQTRLTNDVMEIVDSQWRKFKPSIEATKSLYVDDPISFMELKPSIPVLWNVVYEVAKDSEWYYYTANYDWWEHRMVLKNRNE